MRIFVPLNAWTAAYAVTEDSIFVISPGSGGRIQLQFSADGQTWYDASGTPYSSLVAGGIPPNVSFVRAFGQVAGGLLTLDDARSTELTSAQAHQLAEALRGNAALTRRNKPSTVFADERVLMSATGCVSASPGYISRIYCVTGAAVGLVVYDNPAASSGTQVYSGTLSAGESAVLSSSRLRLINGARAVFASGSFEFQYGQEAA